VKCGEVMSVKKDNFKRIAESRTNRIINLIDLLGNLSNKSYYDYSDDEIEKIFNAIEDALELQKQKFKLGSNKKQKFKL